MNQKSLITAGLLAVGLVSSAAAAGTVVTLTGSTAFRAVAYTALTTPGAVFASHASGAPADPIVVSANNSNGASQIVFEGYIQNPDTTYTLYDVTAAWTGSEAGIAAVAGSPGIANPTPVFNSGTSPLPGIPPAYLVGPGWTTTQTNLVSDLCMSDTSQAVSLTRTPALVVPGTNTSGIVGIVTFLYCKEKNSAPTTTTWGDITNVTHPALALCIQSGAQVPRLFTGNTNDPDSDSVVIVGRNIGSGTHVNQMLDLALAVSTPVDQFAINSTYVGAGVLTQNGVIAYTDANVLEVGPDGFDSGGSVAKCLECDGKGSSYTFIGDMGIPDALGLPIGSGGAVGGGAVELTLDGVRESNGAVENANYTLWGHEHIYGRHGQLTTDPDGIVGAHLSSGISSTLITLGWGVGATTQDAAIPVKLMHADKNGDVGYPAPQ